MDVESDERRLRSMLHEVLENSSDESSSSEVFDNCSEHNLESDTEQEINDDQVESDSDGDSDDNITLSSLRTRRSSVQVHAPHYKCKDGQKWYKQAPRTNIRTRAENIINEKPGVKGAAKEAKTEVECWKIFFTEEMKNVILIHTNEEILRRQANCNDPKRLYYMKETTATELDAFIGLLYIAGLNKSSRQNLNDLWRTDGTGVDIFRTTMSLQRFYFLQNCIRFDDKSTREERKKTDNLTHIRWLFDQFVRCCQQSYIAHEYMTIDEMLLAFRGRCSFRVYIPSKPAKYGIKIQALVDAKSFYIFNLEVYAGKQPAGPYAVSNSAFAIVERLIQPISKSNRNLTFDNWFTSYELMMHLLAEHRLTSTGTVRKNKRCIPPVFLKTRKEPGSSMFCFQKDISLVSYAPKNNKVVIAMSTLHHDDRIDESTGDQKKPEIITFYNSTKAGVDVVDELSATYDVSRNSKRWPMTIFYGILNMAAINANIIFQENVNKNTTRTEFLRNMALSLVYTHLRLRVDKKNIPVNIRQKIFSQINEPLRPLLQNTPGRYVRCLDCSRRKDRKTKYACACCEKAICLDHAIFSCKDCANFDSSS